jgi:transcriptional regulator with XRE-family HTH domain
MNGHLWSPAEIELRRTALGLGRIEFCKLADIAPTTMTRWLNGQTRPNTAVYERIVAVIEAEEAVRAAKMAAE